MTCLHCRAPLPADTEPWYGKWMLCVQCKRKSIAYGWLPEDATAEDLLKHHEQLEVLRVMTGGKRVAVN